MDYDPWFSARWHDMACGVAKESIYVLVVVINRLKLALSLEHQTRTPSRSWGFRRQSGARM